MRRPLALLAPLLGVVASVAVLAGCGEDSEVSAAQPPGPPAFAGGTDPEAFEEFQECLRDEGIEPPRMRVAPGGPDGGPPEELEPPSEGELEAIEACGDALPGGGPGGPGFGAPAPPPGG